MNYWVKRALGAGRVLREFGPAELLWRVRREAGVWRFHHSYTRWIRQSEGPAIAALRASARAEVAAGGPLISVLMPVYDVEPRWLRQAIDSVLGQSYGRLELCIADDASPRPELAPLLREYARRDPRIKLTLRAHNGHIAQASNSALALATGEFVALMDHDDLLPPYALALVAAALHRFPATDLLYSDEDKIDEAGHRASPYFKPDFNYDLLLSQNMISHLGVYRTALVRKVGGFRVGFEGSQDYDLALRVVEQTTPERVRHLPQVLYHWRSIAGSTARDGSEKPYAHTASRRALTEHLARRGVAAEVLPGLGDWHRVQYALPAAPPLVSLIVCPRDRRPLASWLAELRAGTAYRPLEVLIADRQDGSPRDWLGEPGEAADFVLRPIPYEGSLADAELKNLLAGHARGAALGFLSDELRSADPDWLTELVRHALRPEIGAVGGKLLSADGHIAHAGVTLGLGDGIAGHPHRRLRGSDGGYVGRAQLIQQLAAVTAACMVVRKAVFAEVGGFASDHLPDTYYDVDLCLRLGEKGLRVLYTPYAELTYRDSAARPNAGGTSPARERSYMLQRWGHVLLDDPFYNPNLSLRSEHVALAFPARRRSATV